MTLICWKIQAVLSNWCFASLPLQSNITWSALTRHKEHSYHMFGFIAFVGFLKEDMCTMYFSFKGPMLNEAPAGDHLE